jgi:ABC-2 type transport system permease protein
LNGFGRLALVEGKLFLRDKAATEEMSSAMRQIGNFTPLGSALHAVRDSWMGIDPRPEYLGIMAAWALVAGALAARFFRWDQA